MTELPHFVDLVFPATGTSVPLDHGYSLFAALSRRLPSLRQKRAWGVHPIRGLRTESGILSISGPRQRSSVKLRLPAAEIGDALVLAGVRLDLDGHRVSLGAPAVHPITPSPVLRARIVTIRGFFEESGPFTDALCRQLAQVPALSQDPERVTANVLERRVMRIRDRTVVGFRVQIENLEPTASLALQHAGLGGRRHMGAGIFVPPPASGGRP